MSRKNGCGENILIYCTKGEWWVEIEGEKHIIKAGGYITIPTEVAHKYGAANKKPWSIYWAHFKGTKAACYSSQLSLPQSVNADHDSRIKDRISLFNELLNILEERVSAEAHEHRFAPKAITLI